MPRGRGSEVARRARAPFLCYQTPPPAPAHPAQVSRHDVQAAAAHWRRRCVCLSDGRRPVARGRCVDGGDPAGRRRDDAPPRRVGPAQPHRRRSHQAPPLGGDGDQARAHRHARHPARDRDGRGLQVAGLRVVPELPADQVHRHPRGHPRLVGRPPPGRLGADRLPRCYPRQQPLRAGSAAPHPAASAPPCTRSLLARPVLPSPRACAHPPPPFRIPTALRAMSWATAFRGCATRTRPSRSSS